MLIHVQQDGQWVGICTGHDRRGFKETEPVFLSAKGSLMDGGQLQAGGLQSSTKFPVWIIEHIWAYKMMDIQEVVDPSSWPDVDSQPPSLEDSWRLRVISAQVYSIIKSRDVKNFERVVGFLDNTYRLLPRLVPAIKHMKIMFGLKTMVIMWMLKEDKGMINIVSKIAQFFPNKLPQYQDQCSQREMFLMRKNHLDFKSLAQTLAINKDRLEDYMKNQMEQQYGEHYAQKVEDRLLHYLHELETSLPGDTYIDKILKKQSPVTEEEKLLLEVITSDSTTIAATLRKLLHCDVAACHPARISQSPVCEQKGVEVSSHVSLIKSGEGQTAAEFHPDVFREGEEAGHDPSRESLVLLEIENSSDEEDDTEVKTIEEERSNSKEEDYNRTSGECDKEVSTIPQFCSKHQRWVKNILRGCPDNCSEELLRQIDVSSSPVLFQSSSSTSSSQDRTPSDLVPCPTDHLISQTHIYLQTPEIANTRDQTSSGSPKTKSDTSQTEPLPEPILSKKSPQPPLLLPVVRLVDISSFWRSRITSRGQQTSFNDLTMFMRKRVSSSPSSLASSRCCPSRNKDSMFVLPESKQSVQTAPVNEDASPSTRHQLPAQTTFSKLSRKYRQSRSTSRHSQALTRKSSAEESVKSSGAFPTSSPLVNDLNVSTSPTQNVSTRTSQLENMSSSAKSSHQVVHQNSDNSHLNTCNTSPFQAKLPSCFTVISSTSNLPTPYVLLHRLSVQECLQASKRRSSDRQEEPIEQGSSDDDDDDDDEDDDGTDVEENTDSSFDVNILFSSQSSNSKDSFDCDPDYRPHIKKSRLLLECNSARIQNHT